MKQILLIASVLINFLTANAQSANKQVLLYSRTARYHHESIPSGVKAIKALCAENKIDIYATKDSTYFTDDNLKKYAAIIFLNTSGNPLDAGNKKAMERFIKAGGGFVGIHCAAATFTRLPSPTEPAWTWFHQMIGGVFTNHPNPQPAVFDVTDTKDPSTKHLPVRWDWREELYNFKEIQPDVHVVLKVDESSYKGGENNGDHPMAWRHEFGGGRSFYTALGHFAEAYSSPLFLKHLLGGIQYAIGENVKLNYKKAKAN
jgi:type 1 glutamine amidotransferase